MSIQLFMWDSTNAPIWIKPGDDVGECVVLESFPLDTPPLGYVLLDGKQYRNPWMSYESYCSKNNKAICLVWIGWKVRGEWRIRSKCLLCGKEGITMYRGWKAPAYPRTPRKRKA